MLLRFVAYLAANVHDGLYGGERLNRDKLLVLALVLDTTPGEVP